MSMGQRGMQVGGQEQFQQQQQQQFNQPSSLMGMPMQQQQAQFSSMQSQQGAMQQAAGNQGQEFLEMQQSQEGIGASSSTPQNLGDMEAQQMGQQQRMSVEGVCLTLPYFLCIQIHLFMLFLGKADPPESVCVCMYLSVLLAEKCIMQAKNQYLVSAWLHDCVHVSSSISKT